jgi:dienelactone hydrolase
VNRVLKQEVFVGRKVLILCALLGFAAGLSAGEIPVTRWQVLGPFMDSLREMDLDFLTAYGGEVDIVPSGDQIFYAPQPEGGVLRWFDVPADGPDVKVVYRNTNWAFLHQRYGSDERSEGYMNAGYAYAELDVKEKSRVLIFTKSVPVLWVNGVRMEGEYYTFGYNGVPAILLPGKNRLLLKFRGSGNPHFSCSVRTAASPVEILDDLTRPDILRDELLSSHVGVPIANTTEQWLKNLKLVVEEDGHFRKTETVIPPLAPLSVMKVPLPVSQLSALPSETRSHDLTVAVRDGSRTAASVKVSLRVKDRRHPHKVAFLSRIDGSVQYYGIRYPRHYDPDKNYGVLLSLHGSGDEAIIMAEAHDGKDWAFVVAPTDRRPWGLEYHGWGRIDLHEVLDLVGARHNIDFDRVSLTGASMGGHGSLYQALMFPSKFAASAPEASYPSPMIVSSSHLSRSDIYAVPGIRYIMSRMYLDRHLLSFAENARHMPLFMIHGGSDDVVYPINPRIFQSRMRDLGFPFRYMEVPGRPHFWFEPRTEEDEGRLWAVCIDHPEVIGFLEKQRRREFPESFDIRMIDIGINDTFYWVRILEQERAFDLTPIRAEVRDGRVMLKTKNVRRLELHLPETLISGRTVTVDWNGRESRMDIPTDRKVVLGEPPGPGPRKTPDLSGPLRNAFFKPAVLVYGTQGRAEETEILLNNARNFAKRYWRWVNGFVRIVADRDVDENMIRDFNLILFGSPARNAVTARVSSGLPLRIENDTVLFDGRPLPEKELGMAMVYPNPLNPGRLMAVYAGTTLRMEKEIVRIQPIDRRVGTPDFVIAGPDLSRDGWAAARAMGFFSTAWDLKNGDFFLDWK